MKHKSWQFYSIEEFDAFHGSWDALNACGANSPLLDSTFINIALREFGEGQELLAVCLEAGDPIAACVLKKVRFGVWQTFQPSQCPLGAWLQRPDVEWEELLNSLARSLPRVVLAIGVTQQDPNSILPPQQNSRVETRDYIETARVIVNGSFDEYWAKRGKNLRQNMSKQANRLSRNNISVKFLEIADPAMVGKAVDAYGILESHGWKANTGTALHPGNAQGRFYKDIFEEYCRRGEGVVYQLWYDENLVATDLCLKRNGVLIILKTTHDEQQKTTSPAMLMRKQAFERLFGGGECCSIEFYGKVMDWHLKWTDDIRTLYHVTYFRFPWLARLRRG